MTEKCKGITRKGNQCKNSPMQDAPCCYVHSLGKFKGVPLFKNPTFHLIVALCLAVILFIAGPSKKNQETALSQLTKIEALVKDKNEENSKKKVLLVKDLINKSFFNILSEVVTMDFENCIKANFGMKIIEAATGIFLKDIRFIDIQNSMENYRHAAIIVDTIDIEFFDFQVMIDAGFKKSANILIISGMADKPEKFDNRNHVFTKNLYIYYSKSNIDLSVLRKHCSEREINLILRNPDHWSEKIIKKQNVQDQN